MKEYSNAVSFKNLYRSEALKCPELRSVFNSKSFLSVFNSLSLATHFAEFWEHLMGKGLLFGVVEGQIGKHVVAWCRKE